METEPEALTVRHWPEPLPRLETMRLVLEAVPERKALPVLEILKSVEVAKAAVDDPILKSVVGTPPVVEDAVKSERRAPGEEVPIPTKPVEVMVVVAV